MILRTQNSYMNEIYSRVTSNKPFDKNLNRYQKQLIIKVLKYFEENQEFEKCQVIKNFLDLRFNHKENYKRKKSN